MQPTSSKPFSYETFPISGVVAYFSMEIAINPAMPTYSGGLGILAGDTLRSAADLGVQMAGVTLIHHKGYFRQHLDLEGRQIESPDVWDPHQFLTDTETVAQCPLHDRMIGLRVWRYDVVGVTGHHVPVYLLDSDIDRNNAYYRTLTDSL